MSTDANIFYKILATVLTMYKNHYIPQPNEVYPRYTRQSQYFKNNVIDYINRLKKKNH